jgi:hypothetical protein
MALLSDSAAPAPPVAVPAVVPSPSDPPDPPVTLALIETLPPPVEEPATVPRNPDPPFPADAVLRGGSMLNSVPVFPPAPPLEFTKIEMASEEVLEAVAVAVAVPPSAPLPTSPKLELVPLPPLPPEALALAVAEEAPTVVPAVAVPFPPAPPLRKNVPMNVPPLPPDPPAALALLVGSELTAVAVAFPPAPPGFPGVPLSLSFAARLTCPSPTVTAKLNAVQCRRRVVRRFGVMATLSICLASPNQQDNFGLLRI